MSMPVGITSLFLKQRKASGLVCGRNSMGGLGNCLHSQAEKGPGGTEKQLEVIESKRRG